MPGFVLDERLYRPDEHTRAGSDLLKVLGRYSEISKSEA